MNLQPPCQPVCCVSRCRNTNFLRMPSSVLNLEPSSGAFSTGAFDAVAVRELSADAVVVLISAMALCV
jgi:hypothetical protein